MAPYATVYSVETCEFVEKCMSGIIGKDHIPDCTLHQQGLY